MRIVQALYWLKPKLEKSKEPQVIISRTVASDAAKWGEVTQGFNGRAFKAAGLVEKVVEEILEMFSPPPRTKKLR